MLEGYGLSETSPVASFSRLDRERKPGSIGTPVTGVEMRVVDKGGQPVATGEVGEIAIRGHNIMKGYWRKPDETAEVLDPDGWFRTGDIGKVDEDGYYFIVDRKKDLVIRGGFNIYPREIEGGPLRAPGRRRGSGRRDSAPRGSARRWQPSSPSSRTPRPPRTRLRSFVKGQVAPVQVPAGRPHRRLAAQGANQQDPQDRDQVRPGLPADRRRPMTAATDTNGLADCRRRCSTGSCRRRSRAGTPVHPRPVHRALGHIAGPQAVDLCAAGSRSRRGGHRGGHRYVDPRP